MICLSRPTRAATSTVLIDAPANRHELAEKL
jgi:hypothetical protein